MSWDVESDPAYLAGYRAHQDGQPITAHPYPEIYPVLPHKGYREYDPRHGLWLLGWYSAWVDKHGSAEGSPTLTADQLDAMTGQGVPSKRWPAAKSMMQGSQHAET